MKTILIIIFIVIYSTVSAQTLDSEDNGWMFSDYTYKKLGDYSLCFIQGAGVSRHHHFIFERFPTKKDLEDSLFIWQINGDNLRNGDNASMGHVFSREHYQNPYYDRSVLPALYSGKKLMYQCKDSIFLSRPIKIKIFASDSILYNPENLFARQDEVSLRVEEDVIKVSVEAEKNDSLDQLYVSVNFYQFETPAPKDSPSFDTYILPGRSEIMQSRNRISRFLKIEGDTTIALPKEIFEDIPTDNIWINVTKGRMTKSIINNQEFVVLNLSRDGKRFKLEK